MKTVSIVFPVYCEEESLPALFERLGALFPASRGDVRFEFVFVDDGSTDRSRQHLEAFAAGDPRARVVALSRNFGHQAALLAGLHEARGDAVVLMDADLQDPPELVDELIEQWNAGFDIVYAQRRERAGDRMLKRATASIFYRLMSWLSDTNIPRNVGDFRLMDRVVVDCLRDMGERSLYLRGMSAWVGFRQTAVQYDRDARHAGTTKYPLRRMIALATDAILSFSERPLRLVTRMGMLVTLASLVWGVYLLAATLLSDYSGLSGWPSLILTILFLGGVQLVCLGIVGEYISRIYREAKGRPLYIVDRRRSSP